MKINNKFKENIFQKGKVYEDFLSKNPEIFSKGEEILTNFLKNFYEKDKEKFLEIFETDFKNLEKELFVGIEGEKFLKNYENGLEKGKTDLYIDLLEKKFNLHIEFLENGEEKYFLRYSNFGFEYKICIDKNGNFLKNNEIIFNYY